MKIGINASFLRKFNTGIGQVTLNFLRELAEQEAKIKKSKKKSGNDREYVIYLEEDLPKGLKFPKNFTVKKFLPFFYRRDDLIRKIWWEGRLLPKKAKRDKCDVFLSLYQCPTVLHDDIKHIMLVHDIVSRLFPEYLNNSRKKIYQKMTEEGINSADKIITVSKRTEKDLNQYLGIDTSIITRNYIDVDEVYKKRPSAQEMKKVLRRYKLNPGYIFAGGGMEARKNIEGVIRAYHFLHENNKKTHFIHELPPLVIYGKLLPQLSPIALDAEKLIKELNLKKQIRLLDMVPQKDLPTLFDGAQIFVYPSFYEGFGMPVLEAMNRGIPTVTAKNSSLPEVGMDAVLYCHPEDHKDIAMVIKNLLLSKNLRDALSQRGKERAKEFSWKRFTKKIINVIEAEGRCEGKENCQIF